MRLTHAVGNDILFRFNPRIRKGCDRRRTTHIHVTYGFNPRIRKGCDWPLPLTGMRPDCFNPRIRKGCDACHGSNVNGLPVSIHASVKDATGRSP